ncbi:MAG TPA: hypothetical protein PK373_06230 [Sedimentisphaerales bacterium]|nr:hypothetical protein [Phycisphaerae bacterium]HON92375.1 hypothetical protein [Sedimentisphaerales bacterium]HQG48669.1 hypothetical protein [Sedimentisphaerales bacterium]
MFIKTTIAVVFLAVCAVVMHKMYWMLEMCVPTSQEEKAKARARRWKSIVTAVVVGAWVCGVCLTFGLDMPKALRAVVFAGPMAISFPVLAWVFLVY